jgi:hypothetical protein
MLDIHNVSEPWYPPFVPDLKCVCTKAAILVVESKSSPTTCIEVLVGRGGIAPTHSWPQH